MKNTESPQAEDTPGNRGAPPFKSKCATKCANETKQMQKTWSELQVTNYFVEALPNLLEVKHKLLPRSLGTKVLRRIGKTKSVRNHTINPSCQSLINIQIETIRSVQLLERLVDKQHGVSGFGYHETQSYIGHVDVHFLAAFLLVPVAWESVSWMLSS